LVPHPARLFAPVKRLRHLNPLLFRLSAPAYLRAPGENEAVRNYFLCSCKHVTLPGCPCGRGTGLETTRKRLPRTTPTSPPCRRRRPWRGIVITMLADGDAVQASARPPCPAGAVRGRADKVQDGGGRAVGGQGQDAGPAAAGLPAPRGPGQRNSVEPVPARQPPRPGTVATRHIGHSSPEFPGEASRSNHCAGCGAEIRDKSRTITLAADNSKKPSADEAGSRNGRPLARVVPKFIRTRESMESCTT
jgi:hypothetical protein